MDAPWDNVLARKLQDAVSYGIANKAIRFRAACHNLNDVLRHVRYRMHKLRAW